MTVVNSVSGSARVIDFLFQERILGEDDMYRSVILICSLTYIEIKSGVIIFVYGRCGEIINDFKKRLQC